MLSSFGSLCTPVSGRNASSIYRFTSANIEAVPNLASVNVARIISHQANISRDPLSPTRAERKVIYRKFSEEVINRTFRRERLGRDTIRKLACTPTWNRMVPNGRISSVVSRSSIIVIARAPLARTLPLLFLFSHPRVSSFLSRRAYERI